MSLLIAILIVVVVAAIPGIAIGTAIRRVLDKRKPSPPRRIDRSCPYCGGVAFGLLMPESLLRIILSALNAAASLAILRR